MLRRPKKVFIRPLVSFLVVIEAIVEAKRIFAECLGDVAAGKMVIAGCEYVTGNFISN
jgi:hypothetical protein